MSLTDFLLARLAEDEAVYDVAAEAEAEKCRNDGMPDQTAEEVKAYWATVKTEWPRHLADVAAKRRIVELHRPFDQSGVIARRTLELLATPYADHPDYREEWRP